MFEERVKLFGAEKRRAAWDVLYNKLMDKLDAVANAPKVKGQKSLHSDVIC